MSRAPMDLPRSPTALPSSPSRRGRRLALLFGLVAVAVICVGAWKAIPHLRFHLRFESLGLNAQGYREYRDRETGIVFVRIPAGTFLMGTSPEDGRRHLEALNASGCPEPAFRRAQEEILAEGPAHEVTLSAFLIAKYEVTGDDWKRVLGEDADEALVQTMLQTGATSVRVISSPFGHSQAGEAPMAFVTRDRAPAFCSKAKLMLPTEAQWEYAARGGSQRPYPDSEVLGDVAWCGASSSGRPEAVGGKSPNGFGLHDMIGNAWEWCEDEYDPGFYGRAESAARDPLCRRGDPDLPRLGVVRGGGCRDSPFECRSSYRGAIDLDVPPGYASRMSTPESVSTVRLYVGFRPVFFPLP